MIDDVRASLHRSGVEALALVNGHGGNYVLANVVREANATGYKMALFPGPQDWDVARQQAEMVSGDREDMHGGELETSILLHVFPPPRAWPCSRASPCLSPIGTSC